MAGDTGDGSRAMLGQDPELMGAEERRVRRDLLVTVKDVDRIAPPLHLDPLANEAKGHGVTVRRQTDEIVLSHDARHARLLLETALSGKGHQLPAFPLEPCDRWLIGRAMHPPVGDGRVPFVELRLEVHEIDERPSGEKVPLQIFHARFDLALRLGPIGPTHPRLEAPIVREGFEGGIPETPPRVIRITDRPRPIIQMFPGVAAEMGKGSLVRFEKLREPLVGTCVIEPRGG